MTQWVAAHEDARGLPIGYFGASTGAAAARLSGDVDLRVVERATHLFEEPGALEEVARLADGFFARHL